MSIIRDFTLPYSHLEAWAYDQLFGDATKEMFMASGQLSTLRALPRGATLLDVGCGGGQTTVAVAELLPELRITGLDLNAGQVQRARRRAAAASAQVSFVEGSALELPFDDASFDLVVSIASIKHWPDQARGMAECLRVLRPGGELVVVEADRGCRLGDARSFLQASKVPSFLGPVALAMFRTWVAGQGIDIEDAKRLVAALPVAAPSIERVEGLPCLMIRARRNAR